MEQVLKQLDPLFRIRCQQLAETALGNHDNLGKLITVNLQDFFDLLCDLGAFSSDGTIRHGQFCILCQQILFLLIAQFAQDVVCFAAIGKIQLHIGLHTVIHILGPQRFYVSVIA